MKIIVIILSIFLFISPASKASNDSCIKITVSGQGPNVMLLPGFLSDGRVWQATQKELAKSHRVHLVEIAGFGHTPPCDAKDTILPSAKSALLDYLNQPVMADTQVMGHSLGAFMAYWLALESPAISRIIAVDGLPYIGPIFTQNKETQVSDLAAQVPFLTQMYQNASRAQLEALTQRGVQRQATSPSDQQRIVEMAALSDASTAASALETLMLTDLRSQASLINVPVSLLAALGGLSKPEDIKAATALYQAQVSLFPQGELITNTHDRHFMMWDNFSHFISIVAPILAGE